MTVSTEPPPPSSSPIDSASRALGHYEPSLDGLRWIAMSIMLAFHAGFEWGQGAAFSLSMFFTLSGFLITSLLLRGRDGRGRPRLRSFWIKRFRRLMPAAVLTLAAVVVLAPFFADARQIAKLPGQVTSALFYVVNWYFVWSDQSYVDQFSSPSPVVHFWSLAVEEQFYLIMPVVLLLLLRRTQSMMVLAATFVGGALLSLAWTLYLYYDGAPFDRIYYGTDTRASEFLIGAALACVLHRHPLNPGPRARVGLAAGGFVALGITIVLWTTVPLTDPALYRGGFFAFSLVSTVLIVSLLARAGPLPVLLAWGPLAALGRITYGVYLVQWPIFLWLDEDATGLSRWPLLIVQLSLTMALASLMYNLIESPIRNRQWFTGPTSWIIIPTSAAAIVLGVVLVGALDDEEDPLAALEEISGGAAPVTGSDDRLDLLVIADERGLPVAQELQDLAAGRADTTVTIGPDFACTQAPAEPTDGCAAWADDWSAAIEETDPDVVLLLASEWDRPTLQTNAGLGDQAGDDELEDWAQQAVSDGIDLLSAQGATVIWAPILPADWIELGDLQVAPFYIAMEQLLSERPELRTVYHHQLTTLEDILVGDPRFPEVAAEVLLRTSAPYDRQEDGELPRVLIVGDSVAAALGIGWEQWAAESGDAVVWTSAQIGCAMAYEGEIMWELEGLNELIAQPPRCLDAEEDWATQIEEFDPDVVLVWSSVLDVSEHLLPGTEELVGPGDETYDDFLLQKYRTVADTLSAGGATVIWMRGPCYEDDLKAPEIEYLNESLLPQLAEARPTTVEIYPFDEVTCPGGEYSRELAGIEDARYDGIHFSPEAARWFAETYGAEILSLS